MLKHTLLIAFRNNWRNKNSFFINLTSLAIGLAGFLFIFLWVHDEWQMDKFHANDEQLFQVMMNWATGEQVSTSEYTHGPLATALMNEVPEVISATNIAPFFDQFNFIIGEQSFSTKGYHVDKEFFNVFDFKLIKGNKKEVLQNPTSIVISKSTAVKWFGSVDKAVGNAAQLDGEENFVISGVFEDVPVRSTLQFDCLMSYDKLIQNPRQAFRGTWETVGFFTMLHLVKGADQEAVGQKINQVIEAHLEEGAEGEEATGMELAAFLRPFSDGYLYGEYENGRLVGGRIEYVRLFSIIGVFLLLIACINFMNLATAQASGRTKEVGIKKTFGIRRKNLIFQYMLESTSLTVLALLVAIGIVQLLLPAFNLLTEKSITFSLNWQSGAFLIGLTALVGLLAGSYPAFYLSAFQPSAILKGISTSGKGAIGLRKFLVILQFSIAVLLMIGVLVVYQQIQYVQSKNLGYERDNLIEFFLVIENRQKINTFVEEAKKLPGIVNISSGHTPINHQNRTSDVTWEGKNPEMDINFYTFSSYYDLPETMGMKLKEGRTFSKEYGGERQKALLNATAVTAIGLEHPIGKTITLGEDQHLEIIGVMEDFHFRSLHETIEPLIFRCMENASPMLIAKLETGKEQTALASLQTLYKQFNPDVPFAFEFIDQQYNQLYTAEQKVASLSQIFAGFTLLISCLGLFGLTLFIASRRKKEIGIRKLLGASVSNITTLLSRDFLKLVLISFFIATPIAWYFSNQWLQNFAYHIDIQWWMFVIVGAAALMIAWITISFQAIRAAVANPVDSLRSE